MEIQRALHPEEKDKSSDSKPAGMAMILCSRAVSEKMSRLLAKYNMKTIKR
jgi:hypothetical protein